MGGVLAVLLEGLEDSTHSKVPLESMLSLSSLVPVLCEDTVSRIQLPLALRLKPFFEKVTSRRALFASSLDNNIDQYVVHRRKLG